MMNQHDNPPGSAPDLWMSSAGAPPKSASNPNWERTTLEKLLFTQVKEQRSQRRWRLFFRFAWLLYFVALAWFLFVRGPAQTLETKYATAHTAMVSITGVIASDADSNAENINKSLRKAFEDSNAKAIILRINSPGGSPVQAGMINDEITRLKAVHHKPIYAVVEEACASAAYYIAAATDNIYVDKASIVGSIGVLMNGFGFTGLMDKIGVERRLLIAGENKGFMDPFSPMEDNQRAFAQSMLNDIHQQFIQVVKKGRGERLKIQHETFSGLFWTGERAIELGLADGLGSIHSVAREIVGQDNIRDYTYKENFAERLSKQLGSSAGEAMIRSLQAPAETRLQ